MKNLFLGLIWRVEKGNWIERYPFRFLHSKHPLRAREKPRKACLGSGGNTAPSRGEKRSNIGNEVSISALETSAAWLFDSLLFYHVNKSLYRICALKKKFTADL